MGAYINPSNESKEDFLKREGIPLEGIPKWEDVPQGNLPVCLVDNGLFTAAGIIFNQGELKAFSLPSDQRPKFWFMVEVEKLRLVSPELERYLND